MLEYALGLSGAPRDFYQLCFYAWCDGLIRHDPDTPREVVLCRDLHGKWCILMKHPFVDLAPPKPFEPPRDPAEPIALLAMAFGQLAVELGLACDATAAARMLMEAKVATPAEFAAELLAKLAPELVPELAPERWGN